MSDASGNTSWLPMIILGALALAVGIWFGTLSDVEAPGPMDVGPAATVLPAPRPLPPFNLQRHDGASFDNSTGFAGKWSFVFFGYTFCPDVCPIALSTFRDVKAQMAAREAGDDVQFVFISVDPERDTLERLGMYVRYFDPEFIGVTGDPGELLILSRQMGVVYRKVDGNTPEDYLVDHSAGVFLVDPEGRFRAYFPAPHDPSAVTDAFMKITRR